MKPVRTVQFIFPVFFLWVLLFPLAILLTPVIFVGCLLRDMDPFPVLAASAGTINALKGTDIQIQRNRTSYSIQIH